MSIQHLDFYFDYISPYAYFAWFNVKALCDRRGLDLYAHPVLFAGLLNHWGQLGPAEIPPKREFVFKDAARYAARRGIAFTMPQAHPFNPLLALRLSHVEPDAAKRRAIIDEIWKVGWQEGGDLASPEVLRRALALAGLQAAEWLPRATTPEMKDQLRHETEAAVARGVFGVPTLIVGDELFWGNDRFDDVEAYLDGNDPLDREFIAHMLARPRGTDRPGKGTKA